MLEKRLYFASQQVVLVMMGKTKVDTTYNLKIENEESLRIDIIKFPHTHNKAKTYRARVSCLIISYTSAGVKITRSVGRTTAKIDPLDLLVVKVSTIL